jgi:hypothetical protein
MTAHDFSHLIEPLGRRLAERTTSYGRADQPSTKKEASVS